MPAGCEDDCSTDYMLVLALVIGAVVCVGICACVRREQTLTQEQAPAMVPEKGTAN